MYNYSFYKTRIHLLFYVFFKLTYSKLWNSFRNHFAFYLKLKKAGKTPSIITLQLTHHCNYSCIMCEKSSQDESMYTKNVQEMDFKVLEDLLRKNAKTISVLRLTGGEPFMYSGIDKLINLLNELKIKYSILTNGFLLTEERIKKLLKNCFEISFSIDSADEEMYSYIRKNGNLKKVIENIEYINKSKEDRKTPYLNIATACFTFNIDGLTDLVRFCKKYKIPTLSLGEGGYFNTTEIKEDHFIRNNPDQIYRAVNRAQQEADNLGITLRLNSPILYFSKEDNQVIANRNRITGCINFFVSCLIQPDFRVKICPNSEAIHSIKTTDLKTFWNSLLMKQLREKAIASNFPPSCRYCNDYNKYFDKHAIGYSFIDFQKKTHYWITDQEKN
ncbi:MAG: radical SAM protein [Bacteroidota bacterium]